MTIEELLKSETTRAWFASLFKNPTYAAMMDAIQKMALPTKTKIPDMVPGVPHDCTVAGHHKYQAGWSDCIEFQRMLAGDKQPPGDAPPEEEEFAHLPDVKAIDDQIAAARKQPTQ